MTEKEKGEVHHTRIRFSIEKAISKEKKVAEKKKERK